MVRAAGMGAAVTGALAGLLYARRPQWSYGEVLDSQAHADLRPINWMANAAALALFGGALLGSWRAHRFAFQRPNLLRSLRCLVGGMTLGFGAALIPGGNDMLLLWAIPGLTLYGSVAFAVMAATIAVLVTAHYRRVRRMVVSVEGGERGG